MNLTIENNIQEEEAHADLLILPVFEGAFPEGYADLDRLIGGLIRRVMESGEFTGKEEQRLLLHVKGINSPRVLLAGLGKEADIAAEKLRKAGGLAVSGLKKVQKAALSTKLIAGSLSHHRTIVPFLEGAFLSLYRFDRYKKTDNGEEPEELTVFSSAGDIPVNDLLTRVAAVSFARDLINTPSNDMTPSLLAAEAEALACKKLKVRVLDRKEAGKASMAAYLAVAKGSAEPPCFIIMEYKGAKGAPVALIGKSVTFDSGGISLKPAEGMEKMKYDMSGGAAVLAAMKALVAMELPVHVIAFLPAVENMPGGKASRPGDIVKTITGKTVEIVNTDAEGRLILADAIGYAIEHYKPEAVIDIATLTGACSIALGSEAMAMMGNNQPLMDRVQAAAEVTAERVWQMPLYDEYKEYIKSDTADIKNSGGRNGSLVTAGSFLREFAGDTPWVHLDIAGTAWTDKGRPYTPKGATGVGVRLLIEFLSQLSVR